MYPFPLHLLQKIADIHHLGYEIGRFNQFPDIDRTFSECAQEILYIENPPDVVEVFAFTSSSVIALPV